MGMHLPELTNNGSDTKRTSNGGGEGEWRHKHWSISSITAGSGHTSWGTLEGGGAGNGPKSGPVPVGTSIVAVFQGDM